jgi:hypothetical protein
MTHHHHHEEVNHHSESGPAAEFHSRWHEVASSAYSHLDLHRHHHKHTHFDQHASHNSASRRAEPGEPALPAIGIDGAADDDSTFVPSFAPSSAPAENDAPSDSPPIPAGDAPRGPREAPTYNGPPLQYGSPESYFICQFQNNKWNPGGPPSSSDCGPASLAMVALAMGKLDPNLDRDTLLVQARELMAPNSDRHTGTDTGQVTDAARRLGLNAQGISADTSSILQALKNGAMCVVSGNPIQYEQELGFNDGTNDKYADFGQYNGGHFIAVVGVDQRSGNFVVNDPACKIGPIELTPQQLQTYMDANPGVVAIAP